MSHRPMSHRSRPMRLMPALLAAALGLLAASPAQALDAGAPAPELRLPGLKDEVNLATLKGKVVYVDFWASWCGPCKQSFPFMNQLQAKYGAQGLQVVAVNLDRKREDVQRFLDEVPAQFTVALDPQGASAQRFEIKGMPSSVLVGKDGKVLRAHAGFRQDDRAEIEQAIVAALAAR